MIDLDIDLLAELTALPGLPGREAPLAERNRTALPPTFQTQTDQLGNLLAHLPGPGPKLMLVAHMDEVGLLVRRITPEGFLLVERIGGMGLRALPGSRLDLWTEEGCIPAHVGLLPQHLDNAQLLDLKDIYIDIGVESAADAQAMGVQIGDGLTWHAPLRRQGEHRIVGKALDDRLGCLVLITLASQLHAAHLAYDLYLAFVVQEETTLLGGMPLVRSAAPEIVIGVDGTLAFDTPDLQGQQSDLRLGRGPGLKLMDTLRGRGVTYVPHPMLAQRIRHLAEKEHIPMQMEIIAGLSTAVSPLPYANLGIETAALSIPIRYHHSPIETADLRDAIQITQLLLRLVTTTP